MIEDRIDNHVKRNNIHRKQSLKHGVLSLELIDRLMLNEKDPEKMQLLMLLRKEQKKVWRQ